MKSLPTVFQKVLKTSTGTSTSFELQSANQTDPMIRTPPPFSWIPKLKNPQVIAGELGHP